MSRSGLPFIRTSVDHGTAFDIAGKGLAEAFEHDGGDKTGRGPVDAGRRELPRSRSLSNCLTRLRGRTLTWKTTTKDSETAKNSSTNPGGR